MAIYLVVLIAVLSQIGFGGSRVAVSLYALELGANQFTGQQPLDHRLAHSPAADKGDSGFV